MILAPIDLAKSMLSIKLTLTFLSLFPPPTEKIKIQSCFLSLLTFNHSAKTFSQPSSFVLAVNSDTLSVGACFLYYHFSKIVYSMR